jgi:hypothetical protein
MHPDSPTRPLSFLKARPWIWVVVFYAVFVTVMITFVVIAVKHREPNVPLPIHGR